MSKPIKLYCDTSHIRVGAFLAHVMPNGVLQPVAYASQIVWEAEKNYVQIKCLNVCRLHFMITNRHPVEKIQIIIWKMTCCQLLTNR